MGILDFLQGDPGSQQGGLFGTMGPLAGSQKTALLFSGLRDALADYQGRPAGNMDALTQQFRADQMRRGYLNTLGTLSAPSQPNEVNVTPQVQALPGGGTSFDPNNPAYSQPAMSQAGPLAGNPLSDLLKTLPPEQGIPALMSMMGPHKLDTVVDAQGVPHLIDSLTGQDRGTIGQPKIQSFDPTKINLIPNGMMGASGGQPQGDPSQSQSSSVFNGSVAPSTVSTIESRNNPAAVSPAGATGTMQTMPATLANPGFGVTPAQNNSPQEQARVGQDYLAVLQQKYKNPAIALVAYNMGPGATDKWLAAGGDFSKLPDETQKYVGRAAVVQALGAGQAQNGQPSNGLPNIPGYTTLAPKPQWRQITDPKEAAALGVNVGSSKNDTTGEVKPMSSTNSPIQYTHDDLLGMAQAVMRQGPQALTGRDAQTQRAVNGVLYGKVSDGGLRPDNVDPATWGNWVVNARLGTKARQQAGDYLGKQQAQTQVAESTVVNSMNILRQLLPKVPSGGVTDLNSLQLSVKQHLNSADAANVMNAIKSIQNEYARVVSGTTTGAGSSDSARNDAASFILQGYSSGTMDKVMQQMTQEMEGRTKSQLAGLQTILGDAPAGAGYSGVGATTNYGNAPFGGKPRPPLSPQSLPRKSAPLKIGRFTVQVTGQ